MTTKTIADVLAAEGRLNDCTENIRAAFGFASGNTRWREIYPCAFVVGFFRATYRDYGHVIWQYTDWVDLADWFAAINHQHQQLPTGELSS